MLAVKPKTVTRWADAGTVSFVRTPGGHRRYQQSEIAALLTQGHHPPDPTASSVDASTPAAAPDVGGVAADFRRGIPPSDRHHTADDLVDDAVAAYAAARDSATNAAGVADTVTAAATYAARLNKAATAAIPPDVDTTNTATALHATALQAAAAAARWVAAATHAHAAAALHVQEAAAAAAAGTCGCGAHHPERD